MSKLGTISNFLSPVSCDLLVLQGLRCEWGAGVLNSLSLSHTGHWKFNMAPHGKELSEDLKKRIVALHKDGVGYKKIAKTLKLSCSTVAKTIQRFNRRGSTSGVHRGGGGGGLEPLPLWGPTLKCPCVPVCAIWTISWMIKISTAAPYMQSTQFAPSQLLKKKKKHVTPIPAPVTAHASSLRLKADDHNWWTTMPVKRQQQSGAQKRKKKEDENEARTSLSGMLHS